MCISQTPITRWPWSQTRTVRNNRQEFLVITRDYWYLHAMRIKIWLEKGSQVEVGQHFSIIKNRNTVQCKCRNEAKKWEWVIVWG